MRFKGGSDGSTLAHEFGHLAAATLDPDAEFVLGAITDQGDHMMAVMLPGMPVGDLRCLAGGAAATLVSDSRFSDFDVMQALRNPSQAMQLAADRGHAAHDIKTWRAINAPQSARDIAIRLGVVLMHWLRESGALTALVRDAGDILETQRICFVERAPFADALAPVAPFFAIAAQASSLFWSDAEGFLEHVGKLAAPDVSGLVTATPANSIPLGAREVPQSGERGRGGDTLAPAIVQ